MKLLRLLPALLLLFPLSSCRQIRELKALTQCDFRMDKVLDLNLAGVSLKGLTDFRNLNLKEAGKVTTAWASGNMPLSFTLNLLARNPNSRPAAMNRMEWIAFIDDVELVQGNLTDRIEVGPEGGTALIPVKVACNLRTVLQGDSKDRLLNFALNLVNAGDEPTRIGMKIKPSMMVGKKALNYPGYFKLSKEFGHP